MNAVSLLPPSGGMTPILAARWIDACLGEAQALRDFDAELLPKTDDPAALERAHRLRAEWLRWADDAAQLYSRVRDLPKLDEQRRQSLSVMIEHARMVARQSPEELKRRHDRVQLGDHIDGEDLRRELGLSHRR